MYLFIILVHRQLTPQQGQAALEQMQQEIDRQIGTAGFGAVRLPGVNQFENPFPDWFRQQAERWLLRYNDINYSYQRQYERRESAQAALDWFANEVRPWMRMHDPAFEQTVTVRVMDANEETTGLDSF